MSDQWYDSEQQWIDDPESQWFFTAAPTYSGLYHVWLDDSYVYAATTSGLFITDSTTEVQVAYVVSSEGSSSYRTVFSDDIHVYIGTTAGVKRLPKEDIELGGNLFSSLLDYIEAPDITSDEIRYIHGNDNYLILCTEEGVDIIYKSSANRLAGTFVTETGKCFATSNSYYYTVSGTSDWSLNRIDGPPTGWASPDKAYATGSGFLSDATCLTDFFVTDNTSSVVGSNTLFVATDVGIFVYDEGTTEFIKYTTVS